MGINVKVSAFRFIAVLVCLALSGCVTTKQLKNRYDSMPSNKAFAISSNGASGSAWNQSSVESAIKLAVFHCRKGGAPDCRITDMNGRPFLLRTFGAKPVYGNKREYTCSSITMGQAYTYLQQGHDYLDADGDGYPCEWKRSIFGWSPPRVNSYPTGSNCHWVSGYTRKDGTRVSGHKRCR